MNPFDLRGPEFLLFYGSLTIIAVLVLIIWRRLDELKEAANPPIDDPYLVAFLRGGESAAVRVAALSLIDRGLLVSKSSPPASLFSSASEKTLFETKHSASIASVKRPIEKQVLEAFETPRPIDSTLEALKRCSACSEYSHSLERFGLLSDPRVKQARQTRCWIAMAILLAVAGIKILVALSRGRTNIGFLLLLAVLACFAISRFYHSFRTVRGEQFLQDVRNIFSALPVRAATLRPGGASSDLVWLASAFGLGAVSVTAFPQVALLRNYNRQNSSAWTGSNSCSSAYSGGSSSCGGSGCSGGGGCGGGGCGGCGS